MSTLHRAQLSFLAPIKSLRTRLPGELRLAPHAPSLVGERFNYYCYYYAQLFQSNCQVLLKAYKRHPAYCWPTQWLTQCG